MGLENATFIDQLVETNPTGTDGLSQGDNHIRMIKDVLKNQFPNLGTDAVTASAENLSNGTPAGIICMWSGTIANIPTGWFLCNGSNGTPDLRNRFVIGANVDSGGSARTNITGSNTITGGTKDATLVSHTHTAATVYNDTYLDRVEMSTNANGGSANVPQNGTSPYITSGRNDGASRALRFRNTVAGAFGITSIATEGSSATNKNLPNYYALAYIMKG